MSKRARLPFHQTTLAATIAILAFSSSPTFGDPLTIASASYTSLIVPGAIDTAAVGISSSGQIIVGQYQDPGQPDEGHGFVYEDGSFTTIDFPGAYDTGINGVNDSGQLVGFYILPHGQTQGFLYSAGTFTTVDFPGASSSQLLGISDSGEIIGFQDSTSVQGNYLYSNGTFTIIPSSGYVPTGINSSGQTATDYPRISYDGSYVNNEAGINDSEEIVGTYEPFGSESGFVAIDGKVYSTTGLSDALGIDDAGDIVGIASQCPAGIDQCSALLTDVEVVSPEPDTLLMFIPGLLGIGYCLRRRLF